MIRNCVNLILVFFSLTVVFVSNISGQTTTDKSCAEGGKYLLSNTETTISCDSTGRITSVTMKFSADGNEDNPNPFLVHSNVDDFLDKLLSEEDKGQYLSIISASAGCTSISTIFYKKVTISLTYKCTRDEKDGDKIIEIEILFDNHLKLIPLDDCEAELLLESPEFRCN